MAAFLLRFSTSLMLSSACAHQLEVRFNGLSIRNAAAMIGSKQRCFHRKIQDPGDNLTALGSPYVGWWGLEICNLMLREVIQSFIFNANQVEEKPPRCSIHTNHTQPVSILNCKTLSAQSMNLHPSQFGKPCFACFWHRFMRLTGYLVTEFLISHRHHISVSHKVTVMYLDSVWPQLTNGFHHFWDQIPMRHTLAYPGGDNQPFFYFTNTKFCATRTMIIRCTRCHVRSMVWIESRMGEKMCGIEIVSSIFTYLDKNRQSPASNGTVTGQVVGRVTGTVCRASHGGLLWFWLS